MAKLRTVDQGPVRVGVVGCGVVADYGHIPAIHRAKDARLVAFCDPDRERRETQSRKYGGLPAFASLEEMAAAVEMDAVSMPTMPRVKRGLVEIAARKGLHVFSEKPLCDTLEEAEAIVRTMDEARLFLGMAFVYRGKGVVRRMMQLLHEGAIGRLRAMRFEHLWDYHGLRDEGIRPGRRRSALRNLGTLDCGVHHWDLARYMSGAEFAKVQAVGTIVERENVFPDHIAATVVMDNGVIGVLEDSAVWGHTATEKPHYELRYDLIGENGILAAKDDDLYVVSGAKQWSETVSSEKAWDETYAQFFDVIRGREPAGRFIADGRDALASMRVATDVIRQCQAGMAAAK